MTKKRKDEVSLHKFTRFLIFLFTFLFVLFLVIFIFLGNIRLIHALRPSLYYALIVLGVPIAFRYIPKVAKNKIRRYHFFIILLFIYLLYVSFIILFLHYSGIFTILNLNDVILAAEILAFKYLVLDILFSFSIVYLIYALTITYAPIILNIIRALSSRVYGGNKAPLRGNMKYYFIGFIFNVPQFIDTNKLTIATRPSFRHTPRRFFTLLVIEMFLAALLVLYIGLNPFISPESIDKAILIDISLNIAALIPILVFPVYLFHMLRPRIICEHKDYFVSRGLRKRLTGVLITATTILLIFRLAVETTPAQTLRLAFFEFLIAIPGLMVSTLIFIMLYEDIIVERTIELFNEDKGSSVSFMKETEKKIKEWISEE